MITIHISQKSVLLSKFWKFIRKTFYSHATNRYLCNRTFISKLSNNYEQDSISAFALGL